MRTPQRVELALKEVKRYFQEVDTVFYGIDGRWLFCNGIEPINFENKPIDICILEDAADSVKELPAAFYMEK